MIIPFTEFRAQMEDIGSGRLIVVRDRKVVIDREKTPKNLKGSTTGFGRLVTPCHWWRESSNGDKEAIAHEYRCLSHSYNQLTKSIRALYGEAVVGKVYARLLHGYKDQGRPLTGANGRKILQLIDQLKREYRAGNARLLERHIGQMVSNLVWIVLRDGISRKPRKKRIRLLKLHSKEVILQAQKLYLYSPFWQGAWSKEIVRMLLKEAVDQHVLKSVKLIRLALNGPDGNARISDRFRMDGAEICLVLAKQEIEIFSGYDPKDSDELPAYESIGDAILEKLAAAATLLDEGREEKGEEEEAEIERRLEEVDKTVEETLQILDKIRQKLVEEPVAESVLTLAKRASFRAVLSRLVKDARIVSDTEIDKEAAEAKIDQFSEQLAAESDTETVLFRPDISGVAIGSDPMLETKKYSRNLAARAGQLDSEIFGTSGRIFYRLRTQPVIRVTSEKIIDESELELTSWDPIARELVLTNLTSSSRFESIIRWPHRRDDSLSRNDIVLTEFKAIQSSGDLFSGIYQTRDLTLKNPVAYSRKIRSEGPRAENYILRAAAMLRNGHLTSAIRQSTEPLKFPLMVVLLVTPSSDRLFGSVDQPHLQNIREKVWNDQFEAWKNLDGEQREISFGEESEPITINPEIIPFRFFISADSEAFGNVNWPAIQRLNEASLRRLQNMDSLSRDATLADQMTELETREQHMREQLASEVGSLVRYGGYKTDTVTAYKMLGRLIYFAHRVGVTPFWDCQGGLDQAAELDAEVKFLAAQNHLTKSLPEMGKDLSKDEDNNLLKLNIASLQINLRRNSAVQLRAPAIED
jgi:hypothetical protein